MPTLKIRVKHALRSSSEYSDAQDCTLALAANDHSGTKTRVGGSKIRKYIEEEKERSILADASSDIAILIYSYGIDLWIEDKKEAEVFKDEPERVIREREYIDLNIPINA